MYVNFGKYIWLIDFFILKSESKSELIIINYSLYYLLFLSWGPTSFAMYLLFILENNRRCRKHHR